MGYFTFLTVVHIYMYTIYDVESLLWSFYAEHDVPYSDFISDTSWLFLTDHKVCIFPSLINVIF